MLHRTGHARLLVFSHKHFSVATRLRFGGIVNDCCIANFLEIVTEKKFGNQPMFDEVMCRAELCGFTFLAYLQA